MHCDLVSFSRWFKISSRLDCSMKHLEYTLENELNVDEFARHVVNDSATVLRRFQKLQNQARKVTNAIFSFFVSSVSISSTYASLDSQNLVFLIAQAVTQTLWNQSLSSISVIHLSSASVTVAAIFVRLSEKLSDIVEYNEDKDKLNAWKQSLKQRMHMNHDRYIIDEVKIVYVKFRLIIEKKTHILMMSYQTNDICNLAIFDEYLRILRHCCDNSFEAEDACTYLRETLKQDSMSFAEYYLLFCQKKDRFTLEDVSLIDCMKRNISYITQLIVFFWWIIENKKLFIFLKYIQAFLKIDEELQQLKHRQSRITISSFISLKLKFFTILIINSLSSKSILVVFVALAVSSEDDEFMNLSFAMTAVQSKTLAISEVKDICNKWKLYYYCKLQHSSKTVKECSNKKFFTLRVTDMNDDVSINDDVSLFARKV